MRFTKGNSQSLVILEMWIDFELIWCVVELEYGPSDLFDEIVEWHHSMGVTKKMVMIIVILVLVLVMLVLVLMLMLAMFTWNGRLVLLAQEKLYSEAQAYFQAWQKFDKATTTTNHNLRKISAGPTISAWVSSNSRRTCVSLRGVVFAWDDFFLRAMRSVFKWDQIFQVRMR